MENMTNDKDEKQKELEKINKETLTKNKGSDLSVEIIETKVERSFKEGLGNNSDTEK